MGTGGLHGCTMMAIISNRGVWMAHFWERYALNVNDITDKKKDAEGMKRFEERVLNVITGEGPKDEETIGPAVDWSLFDGDCDDTKVIFMSPLDENSDITPKYKKKLDLIKDAVKKKLPEAKVGNDHHYKRLVYWHIGDDKFEGPDAHLIDQTERGISLFQNDGASNWRLFYENQVYRNSD